MQFDLGPAEKIFGPGGVRIKTQGSAELKIGGNLKKTDNPSLSENRRKTFGFDFEEKINMSMNGSVGDKINMNLNYNTDATFDFDAQSMKLRYEGKEDEIIKLIEGGNVSLPTTSLIKGASSLFGLRADLQFGKLKLQTVVSQKKSASKSVSSKGGTQTHNYEFSATEYEENRHFFLAHFFREHYDQNMSKLPTVMSGVTIKRIELWVTNKTGSYESNRNIVAFTDLGEHDHISNPIWSKGNVQVAANAANTLYSTMTTQHAAARDISQTSSDLDAIAGFEGSVDYEKLQSARLLSSSEYTVNNSLGYVSLNFTLQPDEVLAVAFEYTYNGTTYQVGEFSADLTDNTQALFVKALKNTSNTPQMGNWDLMMKNVYSLGATTTQKDKFKLDIQYQSDSAGVYVSYIPEAKYKNTKLLRVMNLDRLDANNRPNPNGQFDYVEGYTINKGRIYFPVTEPFGSHLRQYLNDEALAEKYCFDALYDSTKTMAKQIAEKNKFLLSGEYKGKQRCRNQPRRHERAARLRDRNGGRRDADGKHGLYGGLLDGRGDHHQPKHHRCRHERERGLRKQRQLRHAAQNARRIQPAIRREQGLHVRRNVHVPERTAAHHKSKHGRRTFEKHPVGRQPLVEERKPMADQPDRQNTAHRRDRAFANQLYRGVRPTHCRAKQEDTGVGFLHRRLREHEKRHQRDAAHQLDDFQRAVRL